MGKENVEEIGNFLETKSCEISGFPNGFELLDYIEGIIEDTANDTCEEPLQLINGRINNKTIYRRKLCLLEFHSFKEEIKVYYKRSKRDLCYRIFIREDGWYIENNRKNNTTVKLTIGQIDNLTLDFLNFVKSF